MEFKNRLLLLFIIVVICCKLVYATNVVLVEENIYDIATNNNIATSSIIATKSNIATVSNINKNTDVQNNNTKKKSNGGGSSGNFTSKDIIINGKSIFDTEDIVGNDIIDEDSYDLKSIAGYDDSLSYKEIIGSDEVSKTMLNDLMLELRPYLTDVIDEDISDNYIFSTGEITNIIVGHPVKFLTALYNYAVNSIKEVFAIAEENATVVTE